MEDGDWRIRQSQTHNVADIPVMLVLGLGFFPGLKYSLKTGEKSLVHFLALKVNSVLALAGG